MQTSEYTLLQLALSKGKVDMAQYLIRGGADPFIGGSSYPLPIITLAEKALAKDPKEKQEQDRCLACFRTALKGRSLPYEVCAACHTLPDTGIGWSSLAANTWIIA